MARRKKKVFIATAFLQRKYGGPEEGGWWYDHSEIMSIFPCSQRAAGHVSNMVHKSVEEFNGPLSRPLSSVLSTGLLVSFLFRDYPDMRPTPRPRYE